MVPVKIQCGCGQRYAFDIEPVNGQMPSTVACPVCGADGTPAANEAIANYALPDAKAALLKPSPPISASPNSATVAPAASRRPRLPGQFERSHVESEAKTKVMWGESREKVTSYLVVQGFSQPEAQALVKALFQERAATVRKNGIGKINMGIGLMCIPAAVYFLFRLLGRMSIKLMFVSYILGVWGLYLFITGLFAVVAPKLEKGDANQ